MQRNFLMRDDDNEDKNEDPNGFYCVGNLTKVAEVTGLFIKVKKFDLPLSVLQNSLKPDDHGKLVGFKTRSDALSYTECASKKDYSDDPIPGLLNYYANYFPIFEVKLKSVDAMENEIITLTVPTRIPSQPLTEEYNCFKISVDNIAELQSVFYRSGMLGDAEKFEKLFTREQSEAYLHQIKNVNVSPIKLPVRNSFRP